MGYSQGMEYELPVHEQPRETVPPEAGGAPLPSNQAALLAATPEQEQGWLRYLSGDPQARAAFLRWVCAELERTRMDHPQRTLELAEFCLKLAARSGEPEEFGLAERGRAWGLHVLN